MAAELKARATLNTSDFQKGIRSLRRESAHIQSVLASAGQVVGAFGAAGTAIATTYYMTAKRVADYGDAIAHASERTGVGVEELSALKFAASLADVEMEQLERGIRGMQEALGKKEGLRAFRELGVNAAKFRTLKADEQLYALADAFAAITDPVKKTQLAADIFGAKMGTRFLNIFGEGAKKLREFGREAKALGLIVTPEQAAAAERFDQGLTRIKGGLMGMANQAMRLGPLTEFFDKIVVGQKALMESGALERFSAALATTAGQILQIDQSMSRWPALVDAASAALEKFNQSDVIRYVRDVKGEMTGWGPGRWSPVLAMIMPALRAAAGVVPGAASRMVAEQVGTPKNSVPMQVIIVGDRTGKAAESGIGGR